MSGGRTDHEPATTALDPALLDTGRLAGWIATRRWYGDRGAGVPTVRIVDALELHAETDLTLVLLIVETRIGDDPAVLRQVPVALRPGTSTTHPQAIQTLGEHVLLDALDDAGAAAALAGVLRDATTVQAGDARVAGHWIDAVTPPSAHPVARPIGAEQSNSSIVIDDALVLKAFRRVEGGENPELEMVRFLSARGFPHVAELGGWYSYDGAVADATLGVAQRFVTGGRDGWELVLDGLAEDPAALLPQIGALGVVVARMHEALASDPGDPAFAPQELGPEELVRLGEQIDGQVVRVLGALPADARLSAIAGRVDEARARVRAVTALGAAGQAIRHHGDLHLGQVLRVPDHAREAPWVVLDFEGEPARPLQERRRRQSPLRDVAGVLRSLGYAVAAADLLRGAVVPEDWEARAREAFLQEYLAEIGPDLLPPTPAATAALLSALELEKAVYELGYELGHRPDWVPIPTAAIARLLEEPIA